MSRAKVFKRATELGCEVTEVRENRLLDVTVDAPPGMLWAYSDAHALVQAQEPGCSASEVWPALLERMGEGLMPCPRRDCDVCAARRASLVDTSFDGYGAQVEPLFMRDDNHHEREEP